jgi:putative Holliday junction resolvase
MRILAIDYGQKRIGLAVSDPLGFTAQGIETIQNLSKKQAIAALIKICKEYEISEVVIGLPVNMNGSLGPKATEVMNLIPVMEKELNLQVKTWDERLTSRAAGRLMIEQGLSRKRQKENSDRLAATLILQMFLESRRR